MIDAAGRHPSTQHLARWFAFGHLPPGLAEISERCQHLAGLMIRDLPDGPELTTGLRKLLEAKDAFVRAALDPGGPDPPAPQPARPNPSVEEWRA